MCGIIALINKNHNISQELVIKMRNALIHRGPDASGLWISEDKKIGLAHQRLSIIDLSEKVNQPMVSNDGRYVLVLDGEIYNYKSIREQLEEKGIVFYTNSDVEVVLNSLIYWGKRAIIKFHGPFAFAFCDKNKNKLLIARDRIGEKPLYYFGNEEIFACASEIKALEMVPQLKKDLNEQALIDYLTFGYIPSPKSVWKNVYKLEPGHCLEVDYSDNINISQPSCYWELSMTPNNNLGLNECKEKFISLLKETSKEMLVSDVPIGVFLSGGVDSSGVVAALGSQGFSIKTFTIGFDEDEFNELPYAKIVSDIYKTKHYQKVLSPEDVDIIFEKLVNHLDEPFNDFSYLPTYYVTKEARDKVTVCLSGDGGDELFCGYPKYYKTLKLQKLNRIVPLTIRKIIASFISNNLPDYSDHKRRIDKIGYSEDEFLFDIMAIAFRSKELLKIAGPYLKNILFTYDPRSVVYEHLKNCKKMNLDLINKVRYLDLKMTLPEDMLVKADRVSMLNSLEIRPVYLHPKIVEFALELPTSMLVRRNITKFFLKSSLEKLLPKNILYRKKMGFSIPLTKWFFAELNRIVSEGLSILPDDWFNKEKINQLIEAHKKGHRDFIMQIHCLVFLGKWLRNRNFI